MKTLTQSTLLPQAKIKEAILHAEQEVRLIAIDYFADSYSEDQSIMPLVIQAVERYGRETSFRIIRRAERLAQSPATINWLVEELRREYDAEDINQE